MTRAITILILCFGLTGCSLWSDKNGEMPWSSDGGAAAAEAEQTRMLNELVTNAPASQTNLPPQSLVAPTILGSPSEASIPAILTPSPATLKLTWNYWPGIYGLTTQVWHTFDSRKPFTLLAQTTNLYLVISATNTSEFFEINSL